MNKINYVFINGKFINIEKASVNVRDLGFLRGFGVFDFSAANDLNTKKEQEHLKRFFNSAKILNLKVPYSASEIKEITRKLLAKNNLGESTVRWVLTGGTSFGGRYSDKETLCILNEPAHPFPKNYYTKGIRVITVNRKREIPEAKTLNYQIAYSMYPKMKRKNVFEIIYTPNDIVLEGGTSNIFIVKNGKLYTPAKEILEGITRKETIELAKKDMITIYEQTISKKELFAADEIFITASLKKIMPVIEIDGKKIGDAKPGSITKKLMELYSKLAD